MVSRRNSAVLRAGAMAAGAVLLALPAVAQAPDLAMLNSLTKGAWTLRDRGDGSQRRICLRDGRELIQIAHREGSCSRFVIEDGPNQVVVQYACPGNGYGRTSIRRESSSLLQLSSKGIVDGAPFSYTVEGRYAGSC